MASDFEDAERRVLAALFVDYHRTGDRILGADELRKIYSVSVDPKSLKAIVADLEQRGIVRAFYTKDDAAAVMLPGGFKQAHSVLSNQLGNPTTLRVDWTKEEVWSEASAPDWFPVPDGWKWFRLSASDDKQASPQSVTVAPTRREIDWQMWGVIVGVAGLVLTAFLAFV